MATQVWVLARAKREIAHTGFRKEIEDMLAALASEGRVPNGWFHRETSSFDAFGAPGTTVRVYYARHAGQFVVLLAAGGKRGRGRLGPQRRLTIARRLREWKRSYPEGRSE